MARKGFRPIRNHSDNQSSDAMPEAPVHPNYAGTPKVRPRIRMPFAFLIGFFALFGVSIYILDTKIQPSIEAGAKAVALRAASEALNQAVNEEIVSDPAMAQVVHFAPNREQKQQFTTFDFTSVTRVKYAATELAEQHLTDLSRESMPLPLVQTFGGALFSSVGPSLPVRISLVGSAHSSVRVETKTVGINQTVHTLLLQITADIQVVAPTVVEPVEVETTVPLAYVVVNGDVPNAYFGSQSSGITPNLPMPSSPSVPSQTH